MKTSTTKTFEIQKRSSKLGMDNQASAALLELIDLKIETDMGSIYQRLDSKIEAIKQSNEQFRLSMELFRESMKSRCSKAC